MSFNLGVSLSGLNAGSKLIRVAQNNIANANTDGYARQRAELRVNTTAGGTSMEIGSGVVLDQVIRIKDDLLIQQTRSEQGRVGYFEGLTDVLSGVESMFNETSQHSISNSLQGFFYAWEEVSKYPEENGYRRSLLGSAATLTNKLNDISIQFDNIKAQTDMKIQQNVDRVNELAKNIAEANQKLQDNAVYKPNALLDARDAYLDELSKLIDVEILSDPNNALIDIKVGNTILVKGGNPGYIRAYVNESNGNWVLSNSSVELDIRDGTLSGYLDARENRINQYERELNDLAAVIIGEVNAIHSTGYGLDGTTGEDFFMGTGIRDIHINSNLINNPGGIGLSNAMGVIGNSEIAKEIANLREANIANSGTTNPIDYYQGFAINLGSDVNFAITNLDMHRDIYLAVKEQREGLQGVNIDEEMANLLQYQSFYQANAKMVKSVQEAYNTLLEIF